MSEPRDGEWQALAPLALVFLVLAGLQKFIRENLFLIAGAGAGAAFIDWMGLRELMLGGTGVLLIIVMVSLVYHRRFRFCLLDDAILVRSGLIHRKELRVRFARVQNIQLGQPFYFRPFDLVRFSLETPGAAQKEVEFPGIERALAERLRDQISGAAALNESGADSAALEAADETAAGPSGPDRVLFNAGLGRLFAHGMASNQLWVLLGFLGWLVGNLFNRFSENLENLSVPDALLGTLVSGWMLAVIAIVLLLGLLLCLSGLIAVIRFYGFTLFDRDQRMVARAGLLEQKEQTVRREKITGLTLRQTPLGRLWGGWFVNVRQTGSAEQELVGKANQLMIPGLRRSDLDLVDRVLPGWALPEQAAGIHRRFIQFYWIRWCLLASLPVLAAHFLDWVPDWLSLVGGGILMVATLGVWLRFRHWGVSCDGRIVWVRRGLLGRSIDIVELERVQQVRVSQNWYQRRHQLADLELVMPQGGVSIPFLERQLADQLANQALFAAETSSLHRV